jgi:hypothetical protein
MGWSIPNGARVRVAFDPPPRRGEVWAFCTKSGAVVVHRYRRAVGAQHRFQGDHRVEADPLVDRDELIGRVVEIAPRRAGFRWGPLAGGSQRIATRTRAAIVNRLRTRPLGEAP